MELSEHLHCLFSAEVEEWGNSYILEIPEQEIQFDDVDLGETYRIAVLPAITDGTEQSAT